MRLAKPFLDVGIYTARLDEARAFWEHEVGLPYEELLKAGRGIHQHRLGLHGAVLKVNASREPLAEKPTCLRGLAVHGLRAASLVDPGGLPVEVSPDVAYISFVRDPDGVHLEISQRASLTGALPDS